VREDLKAAKRAKPAAVAGSGANGKGNGRAAAATRGKAETDAAGRDQRRRAKKLEAEIEAAEAALAKLEDELADPAVWGDGERARDAGARHRAAKDSIDALYAELELVAG
jgi:ATP-binding cassette subfamily F protein 3